MLINIIIIELLLESQYFNKETLLFLIKKMSIEQRKFYIKFERCVEKIGFFCLTINMLISQYYFVSLPNLYIYDPLKS